MSHLVEDLRRRALHHAPGRVSGRLAHCAAPARWCPRAARWGAARDRVPEVLFEPAHLVGDKKEEYQNWVILNLKSTLFHTYFESVHMCGISSSPMYSLSSFRSIHHSTVSLGYKEDT